MATSMLDFLRPLLPGAIDRIVFPDEIRFLLDHLSTEEPVPAGPGDAPIAGEVKASANDTAGGFAELNIDPIGPAISFDLRVTGPPAAPTGFQLDLQPASGLLKLPAACRPATVQAGQGLVESPAGERVSLTLNGADPLAVRIEGSIERPARQGIVALDAAERGVLTVGISPPAFMLGAQGFGIHLPGGLTVDSSPQFAPDPVEHGDGRPLPSEVPDWQGVALRKAQLFLPSATPLVGAGPIPIELDLGMPNGLYGHTEVHVPAEGSRPAFDVSITFDDPAATSLAAALPSVIEIRTNWTLDEASAPAGLGTIELLGGRPLIVTGRFRRTPGSMDMEFGLVVEAGGDQGLMAVQASGVAGKVVVTAAALATAFMADAATPSTGPEPDGFGATLHALLVAASGLSAFLDDGSVTVHGVEIDAGLGSAGTKLTLRVDYSVDVLVRTISLGFMSIGMNPAVPMRLRYRNVRLLVDFAKPGLERFDLSYGEADIDVEDPGGWRIESPGSVKDLFDVLGSRSGHGSQWFEIDLRFALDLGPVKVSGATVRATLGPNGAIRPELRGLDASLEMPGLFEGSGKASLGQGKLDLALSASIIPLNIGAIASLAYEPCDGVNMLVFTLGVDLPGPIPLANSGLGLYGLGGIFGNNAMLPVPAGPDPVVQQLKLEPMLASNYDCEPGGNVFGLAAVVGTAADLGFTFSARAVIVIGLPDFALRASLDGKVLSERVSIAGTGEEPGAGLSFLGLLVVAPDGVTIALRGHYEIPILFSIDVPFGAYFPLKQAGRDWYVHLGSDGKPGRGPGPIQARILPDILDIGAWAYLMVRGNGIPDFLPPPQSSPQGFSIGFGAGFNAKYGVPLIYLELTASAVIALGTNPFMLAGIGHLSGSLHLGPISIGASAEIRFSIAPALGDAWVEFEVCGEVDLFFFSLEGCVTIEIGSLGATIPAPTDWPLRSIALSDHLYTKVGDALRSDAQPALDQLPVVWPDVIPMLEFTIGPANALDPGPFTSKLAWNAAVVGNGVVGNERLSFTYRLTSITLTEIDPDTGTETTVTGPLEAAWQDPKGGSVGEPGARELALLTWETQLWTRKLLDGAENDPADPITAIAERCRTRHVPRPGWALGALGFRRAPGEAWKLPTEPGAGPFASVFEVRITAVWRQIPIDDVTIALLPTTLPFQLAGPTWLGGALPTSEREFAGTFDLPRVTGLPVDIHPDEISRLGDEQITVTLTFSEPLFDPLLALLLPFWPDDFADRRMSVDLIGPNGLVPFSSVWDEGGIADDFTRLYKESGGPYFGVSITYAAVFGPRILGMRGVSESAVKAADDATKADNAAGETAKTKATQVTPRAMLKADTIYRIDVTVTGQGHRADVEAPPQAPVPHTDRYWFRTTKVVAPAPSQGLQYLQTTAALALDHYQQFVFSPAVHQKTDTFDPAYLQRYVTSWIPADRTTYWFVKDPVGVLMSVNHVPDLAALYDHDVKVRVRRTDRRAADDAINRDRFAEDVLDITQIFETAVSSLLPKADLRLYDLTAAEGSCPYPKPGAVLGGKPGLLALSHYEAFLSFPFLDSAGTGQEGGATIAGVTFSTSRYDSPLDLLTRLGFAPANGIPAGLTSNLPVTRVPVSPGDLTADGAIEQTLTALGLGRRPIAARERSTGLWALENGAWLLHGLLLEAPEPIHRPDTLGLRNFDGRVRITSLACGGQGFERVFRSSSGDRLLYLTNAPFMPSASLTLGVTTQEIPIGASPGPQSATLACTVPAVPEFAEDLL